MSTASEQARETTLGEAVRALAGRCDYAVSEDGQGFNATDTYFGHALAEVEESEWTDEMRWAAWQMLQKYRDQLAGYGLDLEAVDEPPAPDVPESRVQARAKTDARRAAERDERVIRLAEGGVRWHVEFPYDQELVAELKEKVSGRRWNGEEERWEAPVQPLACAGLLELADEWEFDFPDREVAEVEAGQVRELGSRFVDLTDDGGRFRIIFPFDRELKDALKGAVPGARWDGDQWTAPLSQGGELLRFGEAHGFTLTNDARSETEQARAEASARREASAAADSEFSVDGLGGDLYPFQRAGVAYAADAERCLIADEMGLGKTVQALATIEHEDAYPAVVVVPASLKRNWAREAKRWLPDGRSVQVLEGTEAHATWADVVILNYAILGHCKEDAKGEDQYPWVDALRMRQLGAVVLDESHYVKNRSSNRSTAARKLASGVRVRLLLTGTPVLNRPEELIHQLKVMGRFEEIGGNWKRFVTRYCNAYKGRWGWDTSGASNLEELNQKLRASCYVRRKKEDVLSDLPAKQRARVPVEITNREEYRRAREDVIAWLRENAGTRKAERAARAEQLARINYLKQLAAEGKMKAAADWIEDFLASGEKLVVFAHHRSVQDELYDRFEGRGVRIAGGDDSEARQAAVDRFQNDDEVRVLVGSLKAAGVGITLTAASNVAFVELGWTPADHDQAEDRCVLAGEPVLTEQGWRAVEEIEAGDRVVGHDGRLHRVSAVASRNAKGATAAESKDVAEVEVQGWHQPLRVTTDHRVLTDRGWVEAGDLRPRDRIKMPERTDGEAAESVPVDAGGRRRQTFTTPEHPIFGDHYEKQRTKPETEQRNGRLVVLPEAIPADSETVWVLGHYVGDGYAYTGDEKGRFVGVCGNADKGAEHLRRCQAWGERLGVNGTLQDAADGGRGRELRLYSAELAEWFVAQVGRTLPEKRVPAWVHKASEAQRRTFIDGWVAADGYEREPTRGGSRRREIVTARERLAADAARLLMSVGEKPCVRYGGEAGAWTVGWTEGVEPTLTVTSVTKRTCTKTERVHDLTVPGAESFVVGTAVVHNCHRIGQEDAVTAWYLLAEGTIDEEVMELIEAKRAVVTEATEGGEAAAQQSVLGELVQSMAAEEGS